MIDLINSLFFDYTIRTVALGAAVLGIVAGALGTFALLRRQSLLGDAMSHAALPGVLIAFMLTGSKAPLVLVLGAAVAGVLGTFLLLTITRYSRIKEDAALGIILSVFFGFGLMLLTYLQRNPTAAQAGLNSFLFGQAATLLVSDVITMAVFGGAALLALVVLWKEFKLLSFDRDFGSSLGYPMTALDMALTTLLVIGVVIGLQAVGVVLMSALIVAPAAAARQWTDRLSVMLVNAYAATTVRVETERGQHVITTGPYRIVRLDAAPGALPAPLEMRATALMNGETIFTMHHPGGAAKKTQAGIHSGGTSITNFDYAGGSSGSALFDVNGRLVRGPLSIGGSCASPGACSVTYAPIEPVRAALGLSLIHI